MKDTLAQLRLCPPHRLAALLWRLSNRGNSSRSAKTEEAEHGENDDDGAYEPNDAVHNDILSGSELVTDQNASRDREFHVKMRTLRQPPYIIHHATASVQAYVCNSSGFRRIHAATRLAKGSSLLCRFGACTPLPRHQDEKINGRYSGMVLEIEGKIKASPRMRGSIAP